MFVGEFNFLIRIWNGQQAAIVEWRLYTTPIVDRSVEIRTSSYVLEKGIRRI